MIIKDGKLDVKEGTHPAPELTVTADSGDILAVANGEVDRMSAFMAGKAKVTRDMSEAMSLIKLFKPG